MLKVLMDRSKLINMRTDSRSTCERWDLIVFISEPTGNPNFDLRTLQNTMILIDDLAAILDVVQQRWGQFRTDF